MRQSSEATNSTVLASTNSQKSSEFGKLTWLRLRAPALVTILIIGGALLTYFLPWYITHHPTQSYTGVTILQGNPITYGPENVQSCFLYFDCTSNVIPGGSLTDLGTPSLILVAILALPLVAALIVLLAPRRLWTAFFFVGMSLITSTVGINMISSYLLNAFQSPLCTACPPDAGQIGRGLNDILLLFFAIGIVGLWHVFQVHIPAFRLGYLAGIIGLVSLVVPWALHPVLFIWQQESSVLDTVLSIIIIPIVMVIYMILAHYEGQFHPTIKQRGLIIMGFVVGAILFLFTINLQSITLIYPIPSSFISFGTPVPVNVVGPGLDLLLCSSILMIIVAVGRMVEIGGTQTDNPSPPVNVPT